MRRWRSLQQLRDDFKASGIELGRPTPRGVGTRGCTGKVRHASRAAARRHVDELRAKSRDHWRTKERLTDYQCKWCNFWHVGHDPRKLIRGLNH